MLNKVAIDRLQINKLIKLKKYKEAFDYINHVRKVIELVAVNRVNKFIENNIILKEERELFIFLIQNNINNKLLEEENYILIDEDYIEVMEEKLNKMKKIMDKKRWWKKDNILTMDICTHKKEFINYYILMGWIYTWKYWNLKIFLNLFLILKKKQKY